MVAANKVNGGAVLIADNHSICGVTYL